MERGSVGSLPIEFGGHTKRRRGPSPPWTCSILGGHSRVRASSFFLPLPTYLPI